MLSGATNLMDFQELSDVNNMRHLLEAFSQKQDIIQLLDRCMNAEECRFSSVKNRVISRLVPVA